MGSGINGALFSGYKASVILDEYVLDIYSTSGVMGFPSGSAVKNPTVIRELKRHGLDPWVGKIPWRRIWQLIRRIPWTEKPGRLQSTESKRVGHN